MWLYRFFVKVFRFIGSKHGQTFVRVYEIPELKGFNEWLGGFGGGYKVVGVECGGYMCLGIVYEGAEYMGNLPKEVPLVTFKRGILKFELKNMEKAMEYCQPYLGWGSARNVCERLLPKYWEYRTPKAYVLMVEILFETILEMGFYAPFQGQFYDTLFKSKVRDAHMGA